MSFLSRGPIDEVHHSFNMNVRLRMPHPAVSVRSPARSSAMQCNPDRRPELPHLAARA